MTGWLLRSLGPVILCVAVAEARPVIRLAGGEQVKLTVQGGKAILQCRGPGKKSVRVTLPDPWWASDSVTVDYLEPGARRGYVLVTPYKGGLSYLAFARGWTKLSASGVFEGSEFSTTGWSVLSSETDPATGRFCVVQTHESPGEETEEGRQIDRWEERWVWSWSSESLVKAE